MSTISDEKLPRSFSRGLVAQAGLLGAASAMLIASMLAIWLKFRAAAPLRNGAGSRMISDWLPANVKVPEVATNTMLLTVVILCVMAQWATYSSRREDGRHVALALSVVLLTQAALINAQFAVYTQMEIGVRDGAYMMMFYAITGTMTALFIVGTGFTLMSLFRSIGGRVNDRELVSAHGLYWYSLAAIFAVVWFVVYVQK